MKKLSGKNTSVNLFGTSNLKVLYVVEEINLRNMITINKIYYYTGNHFYHNQLINKILFLCTVPNKQWFNQVNHSTIYFTYISEIAK